MDDCNDVLLPVLYTRFIAAAQEAFFGDQIQFLDNKNWCVEKIDVIRFDIHAAQ